jgi:hypothetical protein
VVWQADGEIPVEIETAHVGSLGRSTPEHPQTKSNILGRVSTESKKLRKPEEKKLVPEGRIELPTKGL